MLNFYANPFSPYATKVHYFLEESGIPYQYHLVNLRDPAGRAQLERVNPFGKIPAIEQGGFTLGESDAIIRYLIARFDRHDYLPRNLEDRARVEMVADFASNHVAAPMMKLAWALTYAPKFGMGAADEKVFADSRSELARTLPRLEAQLYGRQFLGGAELTYADFSVWPRLGESAAAQVSLGDFPSVQAYVTRMSGRPAWKKTAADVERRLAEVMKARG